MADRQDLAWVKGRPYEIFDTRRGDWGEISADGCDIPDPPAGLLDDDAYSAARRSPRVRAAQLLGTRRPDLLPRINSLEV